MTENSGRIWGTSAAYTDIAPHRRSRFATETAVAAPGLAQTAPARATDSAASGYAIRRMRARCRFHGEGELGLGYTLFFTFCLWLLNGNCRVLYFGNMVANTGCN